MSDLDLSPWRMPGELLDALEIARQEGRRELRDEVMKLLDHEEPIVREEALSLLLVTWKEHAARAAAIDALDARREDFGVRTRAAMGIAATSTGMTREEDIRMLLGRVLDPDEDPDVRRAAYEGLLLMHGRQVPPLNRTFNVETDADREWLGQLRLSTESA